MEEYFYLDGILMSLSVVLVVGYHVYLWKCLKKNPEKTSMGIQWQGRRAWLEKTLHGRDSMQVVQTLRNNLMIIILRASISITVSISVAALTNNAYKAATAQVFLLGMTQSMSGGMFVVKYAAAFVVSVSSFVCSSFGVGFLVDTCMLVSTTATACAGEVPICHDRRPTGSHIQRLVDTGFALAFIGNRLMWVSFVVLLWSLGPIVVALCSLALVWGFSMMDFNLLPNQSNYY